MQNPLPFRLFCLSCSGLLEAAACLALIGTVLGFGGHLDWRADLFSHFRFQYMVGLGGIGLLLFLLKRKKWAITCALAACINLTMILPLYLGRPSNGNPEGSFKVMLINVNSATGDPEKVLEVVQAESPDILVLQEITSGWVTELVSLQEVYPHHQLEPRSDNFGIGLYSKFPLSQSSVEWIGEAGVPSILSTALLPDGPLQLIATHPLPPYGAEYSRLRNEQLAQLPEYVEPDRPTLLIGDLNTTPWSPNFHRLLRETGLKNSMNGFGTQPTWPTPHLLFGIPLDHLLHSSELAILDRRIGPDVGSDHSPVMVHFQWVPDR